MNKDFNKVRKKAEKELMKIPGVVAVGVGLKETKGKMKRELCFKVTVTRKLPKSEIKPRDRIPDEIYGFKTDVNEVGFGEICEDTTNYRPLIGGSQIGVSSAGGFGTMGCLATRDLDSKIVLVSNWHVIVGDGDNIDGDRVGQPSHNGCCSCCECNEIADVVDGRLKTDNMDAAIALLQGQEGAGDLIPETRFLNEILDIGIIAGSAVPFAGETVWKRGRSSGLTIGQITNDNFPFSVPYKDYGGIVIARTVWQITPQNPPYPNFVIPGDSGSVAVNEHNQVVLLNFAKNGAGQGMAFNIKDVESVLKIKVLDSTFHSNLAGNEGVPLASVSGAINRIPNLAGSLAGIEQELNQFNESRQMMELFRTHQKELLHLVNHNREVMAAWNRYQGPAYLANIARSVRRENKPVPEHINGVTMQNLLLKMAAVLQRNGSPELVRSVAENYLRVMNVLGSGRRPEEWKAYLAQTEKAMQV